jgi:hypothetical protein
MVDLLEEYTLKGGKARKIKEIRSNIQYHGTNSASKKEFSYSGSPKPVVFKIIKNVDKATGKVNRNVGYSLMKTLDYLARDADEFNEEELKKYLEDKAKEPTLELDFENLVKKNPLETDDGRFLATKEERYEYYKEWSETFTTRADGKDFEHVIFSTLETPGINDKKVLDSVRQTLENKYGKEGFNYTFVLHGDTEHTHVHVVFRVHNTKNQKRLDIKKDDIWKTKLDFAKELKNRGLNYEANINFEKVKGFDNKLKSIEYTDYSWFQSNVEKLKDTNIDELLKNIKDLDHKIEETQKYRKQTTLNEQQKKEITEKIQDLYTQKRTIIHALNGLEYDLQKATKNYEQLLEKQNSISWHLKATKRYSELTTKTDAAHKLLLTKKIDIDKVQIYLNETKAPLHFSDQLKKTTLEYIEENLKNSNDIHGVLNQLDYLTKKLPNANITKEIKELRTNFIENETMYQYEQLGKKFLQDAINENESKSKKKLLESLEKNYKIFDYDIKAAGLNPHHYSFKTIEEDVNVLRLDERSKEILKQFIDNADTKNEKFIKFINIQINKENMIYEYQLKSLQIDTQKLFNEIGESYIPTSIEKKVVDYAKTYVDRFNDGTISSLKYKDINYTDELHTIKDIDYSKLSINKDIDSFMKLETIREKAIKNKDLDALDITYHHDAPIDFAMTMKQYGEVLNVDVQSIKENIWIENGGSIGEFKGFGENLVKNTQNYKEIFTEKYLDEVYMQYMLRKSEKEMTTDEEYQLLEKDVERLESFINDYKNEIEEKKNLEKYQDSLKELYELIENGNFERATRLIENFEFKHENDKFNIEIFYERAVDFYSQDEVLLGEIQKDIKDTLEMDYKVYELVSDEVTVTATQQTKDIEMVSNTIDENIAASSYEISSAISRSFTKSDRNDDKEERLEDWAILKSAPNEAINILKSYIEQSKEELQYTDDYDSREIANIQKDIDGYKAVIESLEKLNQDIKPEVAPASEELKDATKENNIKSDELVSDEVTVTATQQTKDIEMVSNTTDKQEEQPIKDNRNAINYEEVKDGYEEKIREFKNNIMSTFEASIKTDKTNELQDKTFSFSKTLVSEIKRNLTQVEHTQDLLKGLDKSFSNEKKLLESNLETYKVKLHNLTSETKIFLDTANHSDLSISKKQDLQLGFFDELQKIKYSERVFKVFPENNKNLVDNSIKHFEVINDVMQRNKITKIQREEMITKSSNLLKSVSALNPTWQQEKTITKLHKQQNQINKGLER